MSTASPAASGATNADPAAAGPLAEKPLPLRIKLSYGAPSFAGAALAIPIGIHLTIFYSDTILVPLGFIAIVKAVARAMDAITDPVMGWMSDRTRTRWGRRRPWIAVGAPLAALAFYAMFTPPEQFSGIQAAFWFAATYTLYYIFTPSTSFHITGSARNSPWTITNELRCSAFGKASWFSAP